MVAGVLSCGNWSVCDLFSLIEHECVRSISKQVSQPTSFIACFWQMCLDKENTVNGMAGSGTQNTDVELEVLTSVIWAKD